MSPSVVFALKQPVFGPQNQTDSGTGKSTLSNELNTNLNSIIKKTGLITVDGVASTPDRSGLDHLIDDRNGALNTPPDLPFQLTSVPWRELLEP